METELIVNSRLLADTDDTDFEEVLSKPNVNFFRSDELHVDKDGHNLQTIINRVESGLYQPNIDAIFGFNELVKAHEQMDQNAFAGKVVVKVNE